MSGYGLDIAFSSIMTGLSSSLVVGSMVQLVRSRQYFGRYIIIFLAAACALVQYSTYLAYLTNASPDTFPIFMTRIFFSTMFIPLQNCLFFEICRSLIRTLTKTNKQQSSHGGIPTNDSNNDNSNVITKTHSTRAKYAVYTIYVAYLYTTVYATITIAYCVIYANSWNFDIYTGPTVDPQIYSLNGFKEYGIWGYEVFIVVELFLAYKQLRPCIKILLSYVSALLVVNVGRTISAYMVEACTTSSCIGAVSLVGYIVDTLVGLLGLIYILYVSPRYLPSQPKQALNNPQQFFTYAPMVQQQQHYVSLQPPQMFTATSATGSSTHVNLQQQYPIVQTPQQQFPQQGQYQQQPIIVQLPITQQPVSQQYPIVQIQQAPIGYYGTNTGR